MKPPHEIFLRTPLCDAEFLPKPN